MRKAAAVREVPPPLELLCLRALWSLKEANVRDVQRAVAADRSLAYTTVMTLLERLLRKGAVSRRKVGRAFLYAPQKSREALRRVAVKQFLESFFDGSPEQLIEFLQGFDAQAATDEPLGQQTAESEPQVESEARLDTVLL